MKSKIAFITPNPIHKIYQNRLIYDELEKRGWNLQYNKVDKTTTHLFCTSNSQAKRTDKLSKKWGIPYITWIADIGVVRIVDGVADQSELGTLQSYIIHVRKAWKAIAICEKQRWKAIELTGKHRIDLVRPCIDNHTISEMLSNYPKIRSKDQIVVVGAMGMPKKPYIPFLAWKELPEPRPDLVFITYGVLNKKQLGQIKGDYDENAVAIEGLYAPQLVYEASKYPKVRFITCDDYNKFKTIAESKLLIMADEYGGFNLPPIEASFCNTKCLVSDDHWTDIKTINTFESGNVLSCFWEIQDLLKEEGQIKIENEQEYTIEACADRLEKKFKEWRLE